MDTCDHGAIVAGPLLEHYRPCILGYPVLDEDGLMDHGYFRITDIDPVDRDAVQETIRNDINIMIATLRRQGCPFYIFASLWRWFKRIWGRFMRYIQNKCDNTTVQSDIMIQ